ncbi:prepilin-type N-terminal cleavage/methylation domain-containing protein [Anabaena sp. UHCC 0253]|nr:MULTISPECIES: hormogonium polysaccharide secretion pseudopilin HpsC [unclassified Anabaena]MTJ06619.1 prepilin-type N-terminal cleavage/methylation domain-containing protein [Anabaena sp. UHCC 0204]MTJ54391.1 prepilin-type N-terminal cleavage/methylation domain-containing protein [Anabaena sp. UHCC 0253]
MKTLKFILRSQIKSSKIIHKAGGFTLIELLVALLIAFLIITPLLGFMISVMTTDRNEQVKANSEQEIQTALNYISRDVQQAIYIYDDDGIKAIKSQLRYPDDDDKTPILVFWKRELVSNVISPATGTEKDDTFVYSLVAYYIDNSESTTWSKAARISRWQIKDGVATDSPVCTGNNEPGCRNPGFAAFNGYFEGSDSLAEGMNKWKKSSEAYTTDATVLIDYVDQTTDSPPAATCPPPLDKTDTTPEITWSAVKPTSMTGFYVCVDRDNTTAQVFIRGNAMARMENDAAKIKYDEDNKTYFPTTSVRVQGRGFLYQ